MTAPIRDIPNPDEVLAVVHSFDQFVDVFRAMKERLGLTNDFIDLAGGLTKGHADKVLGRSAQKGIGPSTFTLFCELFAIEFHVKVDMAAVKRMEQVWDSRAPRWFPDAKPGRISKKIVEAAKPLIYSEMGKRSAAKRMECSTVEHRSKIARKAAKSRWRRRRSKRARKASAETPERCATAVLASC